MDRVLICKISKIKLDIILRLNLTDKNPIRFFCKFSPRVYEDCTLIV